MAIAMFDDESDDPIRKAAPKHETRHLPSDPKTWSLDDLAYYLADRSSVPYDYARDVVRSIFNGESRRRGGRR